MPGLQGAKESKYIISREFNKKRSRNGFDLIYEFTCTIRSCASTERKCWEIIKDQPLKNFYWKKKFSEKVVSTSKDDYVFI